MEIGAITTIGDLMLVSWKNGDDYGVDKIDSANKAIAVIETRLIKFERKLRTTVKEINLNYNTKPTGTSFNLYISKNYGAYGDAVTLTANDNCNQMSYRNVISGVHTLQLKIEMIPSANLTPDLESIDIIYE
jgi:glutamate-1-semialdehyde aminotransferase